MGAFIAAAVAVLGGKIIGGMQQKKGNRRAADALEHALKQLKMIDIGETVNLADERDTARFAEGFKAQREIDPTVGALRDTAAENLLAGMEADAEGNSLLAALQQYAGTDSPERQAIIDQLFAGAKSELEAGATLPPEFQAELVRSGLEKSTGAGVGANYREAAGVNQRHLLGKAGIELQAFRRAQAKDMLTAADALKQNRAAILTNAVNTTDQSTGLKQNRALNAFDVGQSSVPAIGLTGNDVAQLSLANTNLANQIEMWKGQIQAGLATGNAGVNAQMSEDIGNTIGSILTGAGTQGFGGFGSIFGGKEKTPPRTYAQTVANQSFYQSPGAPISLARPLA